eukprot:s1460_g12.t2
MDGSVCSVVGSLSLSLSTRSKANAEVGVAIKTVVVSDYATHWLDSSGTEWAKAADGGARFRQVGSKFDWCCEAAKPRDAVALREAAKPGDCRSKTPTVTFQRSANTQGSRPKFGRTSSDDTGPPLRLQLMGLMETFDTTRVDCIMGILVVLNSIVMALELECDGQASASFVGLTPGWNCAESSKETWFLVLEHIFTWIFALELIVRLYFLRWAYFRDILNCVDVLLVALPMLDLYVFTPLAGYSHNIELLRVLRLAKMVRAIRIMRTLRLFQGLRLLVQACSSFLPSLAWSMILLAVCMMVGGLVMGNMLQEFIRNEGEDVEARLWIWTYYGTAYRAMYTMHLVLHTVMRLRSRSAWRT